MKDGGRVLPFFKILLLQSSSWIKDCLTNTTQTSIWIAALAKNQPLSPPQLLAFGDSFSTASRPFHLFKLPTPFSILSLPLEYICICLVLSYGHLSIFCILWNLRLPKKWTIPSSFKWCSPIQYWDWHRDSVLGDRKLELLNKVGIS